MDSSESFSFYIISSNFLVYLLVLNHQFKFKIDICLLVPLNTDNYILALETRFSLLKALDKSVYQNTLTFRTCKRPGLQFEWI